MAGRAFNLGGGPDNALSIWAEVGEMLEELADHEIPAAPVHLVHAAGRRVPAPLRLLIDHMAARLRDQPVLAGEAFLR